MPARQKKPPLRSESYKAYIRGLPCDSCYADPPSFHHHHGTGGMGMKTDDLRGVPLCLECHRHLHDTGFLPKIMLPDVYLTAKALDHLIDWIREEWD